MPQAVIFDLGGTLVDWPDWEQDVERRWALSYDYLIRAARGNEWPAGHSYVRAMQEAETAHWQLVNEQCWSGSPTTLIGDGFRRLGLPLQERELLAALDGYAPAVDGWAVVFPDARETLLRLREQGFRLGLLSNTWWAAAWHNADLAAHGLADLLDAVLYTSDVPHSKPHPSVFLDLAARLNVEPSTCVMVGDRMIDDISGALRVGMRAVWKRNVRPYPKPAHIVPTATITQLAELPALLPALNTST